MRRYTPPKIQSLARDESGDLFKFYFHLSAAIAILETDRTLADALLGIQLRCKTSSPYEARAHNAGREVALHHIAEMEAMLHDVCGPAVGYCADVMIKPRVEEAAALLRTQHYRAYCRIEAARRLVRARDALAVALSLSATP